MICSSSRRNFSISEICVKLEDSSSDNNLKGGDPKMEVGHDLTSLSNTRQLHFIVFSHLVLRQHQLHLGDLQIQQMQSREGSKQPRPFRVDHNCQKLAPIQTCYPYFQNYLYKFYSPIDRNHDTFRDLRLAMWRYKSIQPRLTFPSLFPSTWHSGMLLHTQHPRNGELTPSFPYLYVIHTGVT